MLDLAGLKSRKLTEPLERPESIQFLTKYSEQSHEIRKLRDERKDLKHVAIFGGCGVYKRFNPGTLFALTLQ
jgi:hypothetical protein